MSSVHNVKKCFQLGLCDHLVIKLNISIQKYYAIAVIVAATKYQNVNFFFTLLPFCGLLWLTFMSFFVCYTFASTFDVVSVAFVSFLSKAIREPKSENVDFPHFDRKTSANAMYGKRNGH